jgi:ion channel-forming bestrophin family protein
MSRFNSTKTPKWLKTFITNANNSLTGKYHLYQGKKLNFIQVIFILERSVFPTILPWVVFSSLYGFLISLLYAHLESFVGFRNEIGVLTNAIFAFNIGFTLLLVFRTNTANERFWEGRKLWGSLVNTVRNLGQGIYVIVREESPKDKIKKEAIVRLLVAFAVAMKLHLRAEPLDEHLASLMSERQYLKLKETHHPPLQISLWIRDYLQHQHDRNCLDIYQLTALHNLVNDLVNILGGCERILKTPMPLIYSIVLKQLLFIFCIILPLEMVNDLHWWTGIVTAFISFILLSIEEIGSEIEEPFGHDPSDLPLDVICNTIQRNIEELITLAPSKSEFDW